MVLIVAGAIDAMLVAGQASEDIERWIAARQFSEIALDRVASAHWSEPEIAALAGQILEAGFEIASDLLQSGAVGKVFDAISAAQLLIDVADSSATVLKASVK